MSSDSIYAHCVCIGILVYPAVDIRMYVYYVHVNELYARSDFKENLNTCLHGLWCMNIALYLTIICDVLFSYDELLWHHNSMMYVCTISCNFQINISLGTLYIYCICRHIGMHHVYILYVHM